MPHLSRLARKYRRKATFLAIDVYESRAYKPASLTKVKAFVAGMTRRMDFSVAEEDTNYTTHDWLKAFRWDGVPTTFIVDGQERVAWVGDPSNVDTVLRDVLNNTWDVKKALAQRMHDDNWQKADLAMVGKVRHYQDKYDHLEDLGKPDSTLLVIDDLVKKEPDIKYAPYTVSYTFYALLINDPRRAYEYGKQAMVTRTYDDPAWDSIIGDIKDASRKINIPQGIYQLGADCYQAKINAIMYPQLYDMARLYRNMAAWYILAGDKANAIKAQKKSLKLYRKGK
jgi:thiol-disulfide isomerase/thioredoxin